MSDFEKGGIVEQMLAAQRKADARKAAAAKMAATPIRPAPPKPTLNAELGLRRRLREAGVE